MHRIAIVDIGSLRTKLAIIDVGNDSSLRYVARYRNLTHLGQDLALGKRSIGHSSLQRTIEKLREYRKRCQAASVDKILAVATQAVRDAANRSEVLSSFEETLHTQVQVLSKDKEAELFFKAVAYDCRKLGKIAVIEVGGGSVQLAIGTSDLIDCTMSIKTGTAILQERFPKSETKKHDYTAMAQYIYSELQQSSLAAFRSVNNEPLLPLVYGSSCIKDFFCEADIPISLTGPSMNHEVVATLESIERFYHKVQDMPQENQEKLFPSDPSFMIGADKSLLNVIVTAHFIGAHSIIPSNFSISESLVIDSLREAR